MCMCQLPCHATEAALVCATEMQLADIVLALDQSCLLCRAWPVHGRLGALQQSTVRMQGSAWGTFWSGGTSDAYWAAGTLGGIMHTRLPYYAW